MDSTAGWRSGSSSTCCATSLPWYAVLTLPVLFAAGMSLLDTIDGSFLYYAYGWANLRPVRKVYDNIAITGLSVAVALVIGGIELVSVLAEKLGIESGPIATLDLGDVGFVMVGLFAVAWIVAVAVWKLGRIEERWTRAQPPRTETGTVPTRSTRF